MDGQQQKSIGFCHSWSELEKRRKALDLFLQKQLEVVGGVPQKVFYECGATPTDCPYKICAIRNDENGVFELFEFAAHSHPISSAASSAFLVDQPSLAESQVIEKTEANSSKESEPSEPKQIGPNSNDIISPSSALPKKQLAQKHSTTPQNSETSHSKVQRQKRTIPSMSKSPLAKKRAKMAEKDNKGEEVDSNESDDEDSDSYGSQSEESSTASSNFAKRFAPKRKMLPRNAKIIHSGQSSSSMRITRRKSAREMSISSNETSQSPNRIKGGKLNRELANLKGAASASKEDSKLAAKNSSPGKNLRSMDAKKSVPESKKAPSFSSTSSRHSSTPVRPPKNSPQVNSASIGSAERQMPKKGAAGPNSQKIQIADKPLKSRRIRTDDGKIWNWLATICGDANLLKFRQNKQMLISSRFRWRCRLAATGTKCDYKMLVQKEQGQNPAIYQIYVFGAHNHQIEKGNGATNGTSERATRNSAEGVLARKGNALEENSRNRTKSMKIADSGEGNEEANNFEKPMKVDATVALAAVAALINQRRSVKSNTRANSVVGGNGQQEEDAGLGDLANNSMATIEESARKSVSGNPEPEKLKTFGELEKGANQSGQMEYPKEWQFSIGEIWPKLQQIGQELGLKCAKKDDSSVIFSSKHKDLIGQLLVFSDRHEESDRFVRVGEYGDWQLAEQEDWPKAGLSPFLFAVRGKSMQFFFEIPSDTMAVEENSMMAEESGEKEKQQASQTNSDEAASHSTERVEVKRELMDPAADSLSLDLAITMGNMETDGNNENGNREGGGQNGVECPAGSSEARTESGSSGGVGEKDSSTNGPALAQI